MNDENSIDVNKVNMIIASIAITCVGYISSNFRCITLGIGEYPWRISFYLEDKNEDDIEEIEDAMLVLEGSIYPEDLTYDIIFTKKWPLILDKPCIVVFGRREREDINL